MTESHEVVVPDIQVIHSFKNKYGNRFVPDVDVRDEMYLDYFKVPNINPVLAYYECGENILELIEKILNDNKRSLNDVNSLLDFASGYGRFTRFIACRIDPERITVSDIDHNAVDFCMAKYGVNGVYSVRDPDAWHITKHFEVIVVISLFSHLSIELWMKWLEKLYHSLEEDGLLIFTTHGVELMEMLNIHNSQKIEEGFYFLPHSETTRLSKEDYGTTFISEDFVRNSTKARHIGEMVQYYSRGLQNYQDAYIIKKTSMSLLQKIKFKITRGRVTTG
jgi:cyclopropane fatty-acyl-phospholipid synthase-like methyltransferase